MESGPDVTMIFSQYLGSQGHCWVLCCLPQECFEAGRRNILDEDVMRAGDENMLETNSCLEKMPRVVSFPSRK